MPESKELKALEEELAKKMAEYEEIEPEKEDEEEVANPAETPAPEVPEEKPAPVVPTTPAKPNGTETFEAKPDEKAQFAFVQLRKERDEAKRLLTEKAKEEQEFEDLAKTYGFANRQEFLAAQKKTRLEKEAKEKGFDPAAYAELVQLREDVGSLKRKSEEDKLEARKESFRKAVDETVKEWKLTDKERDEMFVRMADDGYTVDHLLTMPKPEKFVQAYIPEAKISAKYGQKAQKKDFVEERHGTPAPLNDDDQRARVVDKEMAEYAARTGKPYVRKFKD